MVRRAAVVMVSAAVGAIGGFVSMLYNLVVYGIVRARHGFGPWTGQA